MDSQASKENVFQPGDDGSFYSFDDIEGLSSDNLSSGFQKALEP